MKVVYFGNIELKRFDIFGILHNSYEKRVKMSDKSKLTLEFVNNYFSKLNPIAEKIAYDIHEVKTTYGQMWFTFAADEQSTIINEHLIKPEILLMYSKNQHSEASSSSLNTEYDLNTVGKSTSGYSITGDVLEGVQDNDNYKNNDKSEYTASKALQSDQKVAYRDEHSDPFSYQTKSQIDLHIFKDDIVKSTYLIEGNENSECQKGLMPQTKRYEKTVSNYKKLKAETKTKSDKQNYSMESRVCTVNQDDNYVAKQNSDINKTNKMDTLIQGLTSCKTKSLIEPFYMDLPSENEEYLRLMNSGENNTNLGFPSEDEVDIYGKTVCEEEKLLDNDINIRKGFEFLNNW